MGRIHQKYLEKLSVNYKIFDPFVKKDEAKLLNSTAIDDVDLKNFTHIIIATPDENHITTYNSLRNNHYVGPVLIEKPAFTSIKDVAILEKDKNVYVGLVERSNQVVVNLKKHINKSDVLSLHFIRSSNALNSNQEVNSFRDVGIHDLDIYDFLIGIDKKDKFLLNYFSNTYHGFLQSKYGFFTTFYWSNETLKKERTLTIRCKNKTIFADLIDHTISLESQNEDGSEVKEEIQIPNTSSVETEIVNFLNNTYTVKGVPAHKLFLENLSII
jgi:predicted dehydrogenase